MINTWDKVSDRNSPGFYIIINDDTNRMCFNQTTICSSDRQHAFHRFVLIIRQSYEKFRVCCIG